MKLMNLLAENYNELFDVVLEKQRKVNEDFVDNLIEIGALKSKAIKKMQEYESLTKNKSEYDSVESIEDIFDDYLELLSSILDCFSRTKFPNMIEKFEAQLKTTYGDTTEALKRVIKRNEMMITVVKQPAEQQASSLHKLADKLLKTNLDENTNADTGKVYDALMKDSIKSIQQQYNNLKKLLQAIK